MDQNRLFIAILISIAILVGFEYIVPHPAVHKVAPQPVHQTAMIGEVGSTAAPAAGPRLPISADRVQGSIALTGAKLDDLVLRDYHETIDRGSPLVRLLEPESGAEPDYVQFGWIADTPGVKVPDNSTVWKADGASLTSTAPVNLTWDNGQHLTFQITIAVDRNYMFSVTQTVRNGGTTPVAVRPWSRVRRGYTPAAAGTFGAQEGLLGSFGGSLHETSYKSAKSDADKAGGIAYQMDALDGWTGITDKYWLTAVIPDSAATGLYRFREIPRDATSGWQVDFADDNQLTVAPGASASFQSHAFVGAKEVKLLDRYESEYKIPNLDKSVDFGWFYFISKPIFFALDWLYEKLGNFGLAIMAFTVLVKLAFFPLANRSYRSMNKMRLLAPKMQAIRERYKDDPMQMQSETMALYKAEKINPASGCLPIVVQIPVFIALNKDLNVSIEMRHAPFFGWIHDLSAMDPTNIFNLFGLIPFDPSQYISMLHLGLWPLIMGGLMYLSQRLNPQLPDPVQARMMQFMPLVFTFMMARYSAGLVIYWSWNNLLSLGQQWLITRTSGGRKAVAVKG